MDIVHFLILGICLKSIYNPYGVVGRQKDLFNPLQCFQVDHSVDLGNQDFVQYKLPVLEDLKLAVPQLLY